jgi:hypothetical protein
VGISQNSTMQSEFSGSFVALVPYLGIILVCLLVNVLFVELAIALPKTSL